MTATAVSHLLRPAQTCLDLYLQLHGRGYDEPELLRIRDAYALAQTLFSDRFRASGKPFVAHLVGTASILAMAGAAPAIVIAGLLHAAYESGDFIDGMGRATKAHRKVLREHVGADVERIVVAYQQLRWKSEIVEPLLRDWSTVPGTTRDVLLMKIANELEDHVSLGMRFCNEARAAIFVPRETCLALASLLGQPLLRQALETSYRETDAAHWAEALADPHAGSYRVPSYGGIGGAGHLQAALRAAMRKIARLAGRPVAE